MAAVEEVHRERERKLESLRCLCASESAAYLSTAVPVKQEKPHAEVRLERLPEPARGLPVSAAYSSTFVPVKQVKWCKRCVFSSTGASKEAATTAGRLASGASKEAARAAGRLASGISAM